MSRTGTIEILQAKAQALGFDASCDPQIGQFLTTLAASKPGGRFLELGTGVGLGTHFLLSGMDTNSTLDTVELDADLSAVASATILDSRVHFFVQDGQEWLYEHSNERYDFIFADTWPGKFHALNEALSLLSPGGIYFIDDLLPQPNWPEGHQEKVDDLVETLQNRSDLHCTRLDWGSGLMLCVKGD